jgi:hypothetical protein
MSHLSIETLARLMDETPTTAEAAHLELCADCRHELEGLKADAAALAALPELDAPGAQWYGIESRLQAEGLLRAPTRRAQAAWFRPALQIAAAIVIFVLGNLTATNLFKASRSATTGDAAAVMTAARGNERATLASTPTSSAETSRMEAANQVRAAESAYLSALTRYAELAAQTEATDPVARLAALESIVLTTRAALGQAPADPVINGYHLTALAQREATLKQLESARGKTWF